MRPEAYRLCGAACERQPSCRTCGRLKAPRGRDTAAVAAPGYCTPTDCQGYGEDPSPGHLWPGELRRMDAEDDE